MSRLTQRFRPRFEGGAVVAFAASLAATFASASQMPPPATQPASQTPAPAARDAKTTMPEATHSHLFDRVGLIGASATDGFGVRVEGVAADGVSKEIHSADLGDVFNAACRRPVTLSRYASLFFYSDPLNTGQRAVDRLLRFQPTCVIAVDFLFWYGYGTIGADGGALRSEDDRLALLEIGLTQLDRLAQTGVPIVVGDFPDMREAVGKMLSDAQMPAPKTLQRLNERLSAWASTRPNVRVLTLSTLTPALEHGQPIEIRGRMWSKANDGALLQLDRLHPTFIGSMAMLAKACELAETCARAGTSDASVAPAAMVVACDDSLCFEPTLLKERFLENMRAGRRGVPTSRTGSGSSERPSPATAPSVPGTPTK